MPRCIITSHRRKRTWCSFIPFLGTPMFLVFYIWAPWQSLGPFGSHPLFFSLRINVDLWNQNSFLRVSLVNTFRTKLKLLSRAYEALHSNSYFGLFSPTPFMVHNNCSLFAVVCNHTLTFLSPLWTLAFKDQLCHLPWEAPWLSPHRLP